MATHKLHIAGKTIRPHGATISPDFRTPRVLCSDPWDYVALWLRRNKQKSAQFHWQQAKHFYVATQTLTPISSPLTSYYSMLNAAKALLISKGITFTEIHGVSGSSAEGQRSLQNEVVKFGATGVLPALCKYLGEKTNEGNEFKLKKILWNIPFIHRAYLLTYASDTELFLPLEDICFLRKTSSKEAWLHAKVNPRYVNAHTRNVIQPGFELFHEKDESYSLRRKKRFKWSGRAIENSLKEFAAYHRTIRRRIHPIFASENRWYLRKAVAGESDLRNSSLALIYAAMHRFSELSRYDPQSMAGHLDAKHNWLVSEFLRLAPMQFAYGIACEITGQEFIKPDAF